MSGGSSAMDETKDRLLEAAGEEFARVGYEGATVRGILNRAGVRNIAAINYYFGDKEQLYTQAVIQAHRCGYRTPEEDWTADGEPAERLRRGIRNFLTNVLAIGREPSWHDDLMLREMSRPTEASAILVRESIRPRFQRMEAVLSEICPEADERRIHVLAFSIVGQCLHYRFARKVSEKLIGVEEYAALDLDYLADHIAGMTLAALGLTPPLGPDGVPSDPSGVVR